MFRIFFIFVILFFVSCSNSQTIQETENPLVTRGKEVYQVNCTACHNPNPKKDGALGPAVFKSNFELLKERILHKSYPPGYQPKRNSQVMQAMPQLEAELKAIEAFLNHE